jgi:hypothetical protein
MLVNRQERKFRNLIVFLSYFLFTPFITLEKIPPILIDMLDKIMIRINLTCTTSLLRSLSSLRIKFIR